MTGNERPNNIPALATTVFHAVPFTCVLPRTRTRLGDRSFAVAGPRVWNCLPAALRAVEDYDLFKKLLKTHLFDQAAAPSDFLLLGAVYKLTLYKVYKLYKLLFHGISTFTRNLPQASVTLM